MSGRYSVRVLRFEEGGSLLVVKGPRIARAGSVVACRADAYERIARAEVRRMLRGRPRWRASEPSPLLVVLTDRLSGEVRRFPSVGERTSWQQAALFLVELRAANRRAVA